MVSINQVLTKWVSFGRCSVGSNLYISDGRGESDWCLLSSFMDKLFLAMCCLDLLAKLCSWNILHGGLYIISYWCLKFYDKCDSLENPCVHALFCGSAVWLPQPYKTEIKVLLSHFHEEAWVSIPKACSCGRIRFLEVVGQRSLFPCWPSDTGQTQLRVLSTFLLVCLPSPSANQPGHLES